VASLCKTLAGNDIQLMTITENVKLSLNYYEHLRIQQKKDFRDRYTIIQEVEKMGVSERATK
jgi:hypothetical protein